MKRTITLVAGLALALGCMGCRTCEVCWDVGGPCGYYSLAGRELPPPIEPEQDDAADEGGKDVLGRPRDTK